LVKLIYCLVRKKTLSIVRFEAKLILLETKSR
jgi:hypothetical protein